ncbi:MAG: hypothetical protein KGJ28_07795, partial [Alphaproteobacteria bacterium]|nr:hypothetical protein [Alphaproteobacteria bacterium]
ELEGILTSISEAFRLYFFDPSENLSLKTKEFIMHRGLGGFEMYSGWLPSEIWIKKSIVKFFAREYKMTFKWCTAENEVIEGSLPF